VEGKIRYSFPSFLSTVAERRSARLSNRVEASSATPEAPEPVEGVEGSEGGEDTPEKIVFYLGGDAYTAPVG